jgi:acetoin utilization deacetylase AcuC-like enzyme
MRLFFTDRYVLPLPEGHRFPMAKYARLRERVEAELVPPHELVAPDAATDVELLRAHDAAYFARVVSGTLAREEVRRIGFPWSAEMVERSRRSAGATLGACRAALAGGEGIAVNLAGGTHHAFADRGEGYCVFNDTAVAARAMQAEGLARCVLVVDCDVHQGNGTAAIFRGDPTVFTFSIHGAKNFPFRKETSDLDVELADGTGDAEYAAALEGGLAEALARCEPDLAVYLAGADPLEGDRLGRLRVSKAGLAARDRFVLETLRGRGIPVAVTMGGGYGRSVDDTVDVHFETVRIAAEVSSLSSPPAPRRLARSAPV